ncbi:MAG TPA: FtsQ-type POTRA domain-containing protein, partial [Armatimonadota bacterium]|nr:FtsQ-type POTRA domain-containing protein [Armatimonadota bacterium]
NLFQIRLKEARQRLLEVPAVADVTLHRRLPNRVLVRVHERQAMACVAAKNALFTIDATGIAFRKDAKPPRGLPLVTGLETKPLQLGGRIDAERARELREFVEAAAEYPQRGVPRISIDQNGNLCFNSAELGYQVRLGPAVQLKEKLALLAALERSLPDIRDRCQYIDLSCLEAPAWKPKKVALATNDHAGESRPVAPSGETLHGRGGFAQD